MISEKLNLGQMCLGKVIKDILTNKNIKNINIVHKEEEGKEVAHLVWFTDDGMFGFKIPIPDTCDGKDYNEPVNVTEQFE